MQTRPMLLQFTYIVEGIKCMDFSSRKVIFWLLNRVLVWLPEGENRKHCNDIFMVFQLLYMLLGLINKNVSFSYFMGIVVSVSLYGCLGSMVNSAQL